MQFDHYNNNRKRNISVNKFGVLAGFRKVKGLTFSTKISNNQIRSYISLLFKQFHLPMVLAISITENDIKS